MFGKFFKKGPSKNAASPVTADVLNTIDVFITVINDYSGEVEGLYREVGDEKAVKQLEAAALAGNFDERKLNAACTPLNPHVLTSTLKRILLAHQPLVPFEHVDVIVSSDDLTGVLHDLPAGHKETLEVFLRHVWTISRNRKPQMDLTALADQLTACILRRAGDDSKTVSPETKAAFKKLVSQKNDLFRSGVSKPGVSGVEDALAAKKGAPHADPAPDGNVMNRSVKITPPKGFPVITDEEVKSILGIFGEVHQVGSKSKFKIVMFGSVAEAVRCVKHWDDEHNTLYECKLAYLGDQILLAQPPTARPSDIALKAGVESFSDPLSSFESAGDAEGGRRKEVAGTEKEIVAQSEQELEKKSEQHEKVPLAVTGELVQWPSASRSAEREEVYPAPFSKDTVTRGEGRRAIAEEARLSREGQMEAKNDIAHVESSDDNVDPRPVPFGKDPVARGEGRRAIAEEARLSREREAAVHLELNNEESSPQLPSKTTSPTVRKLNAKKVTVNSPNSAEARPSEKREAVAVREGEESHRILQSRELNRLGSPDEKKYDSKGRMYSDQNPILNIPRAPERHVDEHLDRDKISTSIELPTPVPDYTADESGLSLTERSRHARRPREETRSRWDTFGRLDNGDEAPLSRSSRDEVLSDRQRHVPFVSGMATQSRQQAPQDDDRQRLNDPERIAQRLARALLRQHAAPEPLRQYAHRPPTAPYPHYPVHVDLNIRTDGRQQSPPRFGELDPVAHQPSVTLRGRPTVENVDSTYRIVDETKMPWPVREAPIDSYSAGREYIKHATESIFASREPPGAEVAIYDNRVRYLEAELRARTDRQRAEEGERLREQEAWTQELTVSRIRTAEQQREIGEARDSIRHLRSELACRDGEIAALTAAKDSAEGTVNSAKSRAEREAMGTVLSQQRLIALMEEERDGLHRRAGQLASQIEELTNENKQLQIEAMEWRNKALATEQAFVAFAGERAVASANRDMGTIVEDIADADSADRRRGEAKLAAQTQAKRYIDKKNGENPVLILNAKYLNDDSSAGNHSNNHNIGEGRKDLVVPHKEYTYRPDNSRRLREDLLSSRARVEEALRYQPTPAMNSRKRTAASDWVPHLGRGVGNLPRDIPSSYQPRTPELKNWLRGSNSAPGGARSDLYY